MNVPCGQRSYGDLIPWDVTVDVGNRASEAWALLHQSGGYNRTNPPLNAPAPM